MTAGPLGLTSQVFFFGGFACTVSVQAPAGSAVCLKYLLDTLSLLVCGGRARCWRSTPVFFLSFLGVAERQREEEKEGLWLLLPHATCDGRQGEPYDRSPHGVFR